MKSRIKNMAMCFVALFFAVSIAQAQSVQYDRATYSQVELEQMLAPVALYPDALLSQVLMAATYPTEVVEAAYWLRANPGLRGEDAIRAAESMQWDISVKSLLPFPNLLNTMESRYDWTQNLGNAFLGQQAQVMDTVQVLRQRAMTAGYLRSDSHISVVQDGPLISVTPAQPTAVYVPYYNPSVVYGHWPQPAYAPVAWDPWPGYPPRRSYSGWIWAPVATVVTAGVLFAVFDWRHHHVYHRPQVNYWHRHPHYELHRNYGPQHQWRHDPRHRREVPYRHPAAERHYGKTARSYNSKVGPRPTAHDIRSGRHNFHASPKPHDRAGDHRKPDNRRTEASAHRSNGGAQASAHRPQSTPRGVAHGVHGAQPSAHSQKNQQADRKSRGQDQRAASAHGRDNGHRAPSAKDNNHQRGDSAKGGEKQRHDASSKRDDKSHRDRD